MPDVKREQQDTGDKTGQQEQPVEWTGALHEEEFDVIKGSEDSRTKNDIKNKDKK